MRRSVALLALAGARPAGIGIEADRLALRVEARLRQLLGPLLGDDDIAALDGLVVALPQRVGPGLAGRRQLQAALNCLR